MHSEFEKFFIIFTIFPTVFVHFLAIGIKGIRIVALRVFIGELQTLALGQFNDFRSQFTRKLTALAENHIPCIVVNHCPTLFTLHTLHHIHQGHILHILAKWSNQRRIAELRPYIFHFFEKHHYKVVKQHWFLALSFQYEIYTRMHALQVGHHRTHHTTRKTATEQQ